MDGLAYHETMELHELINFKTLTLAKAKMMQGLVFDQELKALMQEEVQLSYQGLKELQDHYAKVHLH